METIERMIFLTPSLSSRLLEGVELYDRVTLHGVHRDYCVQKIVIKEYNVSSHLRIQLHIQMLHVRKARNEKRKTKKQFREIRSTPRVKCKC